MHNFIFSTIIRSYKKQIKKYCKNNNIEYEYKKDKKWYVFIFNGISQFNYIKLNNFLDSLTFFDEKE